MKKQYIITLLITSLIFTGCSKYLDVAPKSSVAEEQMFASEIGFDQALVGVYSQLGTQNLYGDRLSLGFVSALAQNYTQSVSTAPYYNTRALDYNTDEVRNSLSGIWSSSYNAIAGLNKILEKAEANRAVLSNDGYNRIKGEALALRAYLHFDLFRLFGPEYVAGINMKSIPYETKVDAFANVPLSSKDFCAKVLEDIQESTALLKDIDPIFNTSTDINTRRIKLNYYGVKGLEARVNMYIGNKVAAAQAAREVIDSQKFPFVTVSTVNTTAGTKDRLFLNELVFAVRSRNILDWTERYFRFYMNANYGLTRTAANFNTIYESSTTDIRKLYLFEQDQNVVYPSKFWQTYTTISGESLTSARRKDQIVPLIRISEMYYILAECLDNANEGIIELNKVRTARALVKLPETQTTTDVFLNAEIQKEYHKEFYAEGQYFFYLKRKNIKRLPFLTVDKPLEIYKLPIPDVELEYNPTY